MPSTKALSLPVQSPRIASVNFVPRHHFLTFRFGIAGNSLGHSCVRRRVPSKGGTTKGTNAKDMRGKSSSEKSSADGGTAASSPSVPQSELKAGALTESDLASESENARAIRRMVRKARASGASADGTSPSDASSGAASTPTTPTGAAAESVAMAIAGASLGGASPHKTENHGSGLVWLPTVEPPGGGAAAVAPEAMLDLSPREQRIRARRSERRPGSQPVDGDASSTTSTAAALTAVPSRRAIPVELRAHGKSANIVLVLSPVFLRLLFDSFITHISVFLCSFSRASAACCLWVSIFLFLGVAF